MKPRTDQSSSYLIYVQPLTVSSPHFSTVLTSAGRHSAREDDSDQPPLHRNINECLRLFSLCSKQRPNVWNHKNIALQDSAGPAKQGPQFGVLKEKSYKSCLTHGTTLT